MVVLCVYRSVKANFIIFYILYMKKLPSESENTPDNNGLYDIWMCFSIGQSQSGSPAATEYHPLSYTKVFTKLFQIRDQIPCGILLHIVKIINGSCSSQAESPITMAPSLR